MTACSDGRHQDLHDFIGQVAKRPGRAITPIPDFKPSESYVYPSKIKRRDPFAKKRKRNTSAVDAPDLQRAKQPLEAFPLDGLHYVGHLQKSGTYWALIQAPNQELHKITIGQYIGKNHGRVVEIRPQVILIKETVRVDGRWQKKIVHLKLK